MKKWYSLIDKIYRIENLKKAFKGVKKNKGAPGIDGETVQIFEEKLELNIKFLHESLKANKYQPSPVRRVEIEKPDGGIRLLGIPTVKDRVVQQAIVNIIEPIFEVTFHPSSYGYRPNRSQQQAVAKAERFMNKYRLDQVVDMDLSKCFDTLDHELMIEAVADRISDGKVLSLIGSFLKSGVMQEDNYIETEVGSPQGGVISPLLSNIYLNKFDQKMKGKGIRIVRYADDILIFARTKQRAGNYLTLATKILEEELKLKVNQKKTKITNINEGVSFLGFQIFKDRVGIDPKRVKRFKDKIRKITKRNSGKPIEKTIEELNPFLRGWINYYRAADIKSFTSNQMGWIRRRLRMIKMVQWKTYKPMHKLMKKKGYRKKEKMDVKRWKNSKTQIIHMLLPNKYFEELGLINLCNYKVGLLSNYYE
ncbi:MAG TPA: group II intron reverse transcriptase/maturase [Clostridia bacterium]|nr:group II intron reverse transcriptase/maturase [Clostridia bacterium]